MSNWPRDVVARYAWSDHLGSICFCSWSWWRYVVRGLRWWCGMQCRDWRSWRWVPHPVCAWLCSCWWVWVVQCWELDTQPGGRMATLRSTAHRMEVGRRPVPVGTRILMRLDTGPWLPLSVLRCSRAELLAEAASRLSAFHREAERTGASATRRVLSLLLRIYALLGPLAGGATHLELISTCPCLLSWHWPRRLEVSPPLHSEGNHGYLVSNRQDPSNLALHLIEAWSTIVMHTTSCGYDILGSGAGICIVSHVCLSFSNDYWYVELLLPEICGQRDKAVWGSLWHR